MKEDVRKNALAREAEMLAGRRREAEQRERHWQGVQTSIMQLSDRCK
jgi:hypothetical protein